MYHKFNLKDLLYSLITGLTTGFLVWRVFLFLEFKEFANISYAWLIVVVPILWILGVNLGYFLGRWFVFFNQFGKFVAVGFTNTAVDFGVLNFFIASSGMTSGIMYSVFKTYSFIIALLHSYIWNKFWVFEAGKNHNDRQEFFNFIVITMGSLLINVVTASFVVNILGPRFGYDEKTWANIGAVFGSALGLLFNFIGFKMFVFKK
jgi:putative flippase GtrA